MRKKSHLSLAKSEPVSGLSPFEEFERRIEEFMHRPFSMMPPWWSHGPSLAEEIFPTVDIYEKGREVVLKAEIPGVKKEDIHVDINLKTVTISGEKKKEEETERKDYHRLERSYGSFVRTFSLPSEVQTDMAKATFKDGVLEIRVPKTEEAASRTRQVKVE
jgi:HSP20 family protein